MTFQEWSEEYRTASEILNEKIHRLKSELKTAEPSKILTIERSIRIMYPMYLDCKKVADILFTRKGDC